METKNTLIISNESAEKIDGIKQIESQEYNLTFFVCEIEKKRRKQRKALFGDLE